MKIVWIVIEVLVTAAASAVAAAATMWGWNLAVHGAGTVDWTAVVRLGLLLGVGLPVTRRAAAPRGSGSCAGPN